MTLALSVLLAALLGFAAHRAGICGVRAVAEILSTGHSLMLQSFIKAGVWALGIAVPLAWLAVVPSHAPHVFALSLPALAGGAVFGMGAAINDGCAFSTLTRLVSGELKLLFTLLGFLAGFELHGLLLPQWHSPPAAPLLALYQFKDAYLLLLLPIWSWMAYELWRLWATRPAGVGWRQRLLANQYRLSTAAFLFGVSNALLISIWGGWAYTGTLHQLVEHPAVDGGALVRLLLFAALLGGMLFSALQRRGVVWRLGVPRQWLLHLAAGTCMGVGIAMTPGGNAGLLLEGMPMLSPHALPAYLAMMAGMAVVILLKKRFSRQVSVVDCQGDLVRAGSASS
ncbi:YeeE/YedE thiosulfate transporter family protein [Candidatus Thiothrix sp. Deng01]|uniref:YeeE/YedE thiosulfate transporter family protein n=1 Tax=Candidatus Thiothrix phosphatis TaxID=3112415 RepID=A0ABU6D0G3_9GAMM|nr:YeeE/YedE thiosulfate transporter family protein [Candidatus Thiothrix sp. Deng01]MEB4592520.1 YeeE/YedE thiosulfate transporter family protein [Candidatus Thiothrix sp. Deng01]